MLEIYKSKSKICMNFLFLHWQFRFRSCGFGKRINYSWYWGRLIAGDNLIWTNCWEYFTQLRLRLRLLSLHFMSACKARSKKSKIFSIQLRFTLQTTTAFGLKLISRLQRRAGDLLQSSRMSKYDTLRSFSTRCSSQIRNDGQAKSSSSGEWSAFYIKLFLSLTLPADILMQFLPDISTI